MRQNGTYNKKLIQRLVSRLKRNKRDYSIDSPFYNNVIIIDEVHNFVSQIQGKPS